MTRNTVLACLQAHPDTFLSGADLARRLNLSRTAVWKAIGQLREAGYAIESVPRRGHRLLSFSDVLSAEGIARFLTHPELSLQVFPVVTSTNSVLKELAAQEAPAPLALVAGSQTAGRGRLGRSFYSPPGSGLYLSLLLRPQLPAREATALTACAAVAAAEAIEELSGVPAQIKWVNDLLLDERKICGILTEAGLDLESGRMNYVVIGIGINLRPPEGGFPEEIHGIAGSAFGEKPVPDLRNRLAAGILNRLLETAGDPASETVFGEYRRRSVVLGKSIRILSPGKNPVPADVLSLERDFSLRVRLADGSVQTLHSGEISIRF